MQMIEGQFTNADGRYAIVVGRFNQFVVDSLVEGAVDALLLYQWHSKIRKSHTNKN